MFRLTLVFVALLTAGCVSLDPDYSRPAAPVPATLPGAHGEATAVVGSWQQVVNDARLKKVVSMALTSNRDLQKAIADIEAARAQYGETRASLFPTVDAELSHTRSKTVASGLTSSAEADGAVSSFELDLFGKNQSLSRAARETWLASEYTAQNTRLTMIADLTTAWVTPDGGRHRFRGRPQRCRKRLPAGACQRRQLSHPGGAGQKCAQFTGR